MARSDEVARIEVHGQTRYHLKPDTKRSHLAVIGRDTWHGAAAENSPGSKPPARPPARAATAPHGPSCHCRQGFKTRRGLIGRIVDWNLARLHSTPFRVENRALKASGITLHRQSTNHPHREASSTGFKRVISRLRGLRDHRWPTQAASYKTLILLAFLGKTSGVGSLSQPETVCSHVRMFGARRFLYLGVFFLLQGGIGWCKMGPRWSEWE